MRMNLRKVLRSKNGRNITLLGVIVLLFGVFSFFSRDLFSLNGLISILRQSSGLALASVAMTMIIISGGIDLSVSSVIAFSGAVGAYVMQLMDGMSPVLIGVTGIGATFLVSALFAVINGIIVGYFRIAPFIATLATMSLARGLTMALLQSKRILVRNEVYNFLAHHSIGRIPFVVIIVILAFGAGYYLLNRTYFGRKTYAIGDSRRAARASGINPSFHQLKVFLVSSVFVSLAAIFITGRASSAQPFAGMNMEFEIITAVVIGGASLLGGIGDIKGSFLGVILTAVIFTGLARINIPPFINYIAKGLLILIAVLSNRLSDRRLSLKTIDKKMVNKTHDVRDLIHDNKQTGLVVEGITKTFPGVKALDDVRLALQRGEIHALIGENGAGKSTLMKIISGVYTRDAGRLLINDLPFEIENPKEAQRLGIATIFQELSGVDDLEVWQNISLGQEVSSAFGKLNKSKMKDIARETLSVFDLEHLLNRKVGELSVGQQQMIEIAKAIAANAWLVIMDEPTAALSEEDTKRLFEVIRKMKSNNVAVVYISHRMDEIQQISDRITILRDGKNVITDVTTAFDDNKIIKHMVGRDLLNIYDRGDNSHVDYEHEILRVENLSKQGQFQNVNFSLYRGEVLGFSGLMGAGRTEIMRSLFGLNPYDSGKVYLDGKQIRIRNTDDAVEFGIAMVSEDRRSEGIIPNMSVRENTTIVFLKTLLNQFYISKRDEKMLADKQITELNIRTPSAEQIIANLSGGNQQKVCIAKWLVGNPRILILDEPTRGIDIGAKAEIHRIIRELTKQGISVILVSSELPEIIGATDRIIVLYKGICTGEFDKRTEEVSQELIIKSASGLELREE